MNDATIAADHVQLEKLLYEIERTIPNVDAASQARLYYSIGTVYAILQKLRDYRMKNR